MSDTRLNAVHDDDDEKWSFFDVKMKKVTFLNQDDCCGSCYSQILILGDVFPYNCHLCISYRRDLIQSVERFMAFNNFFIIKIQIGKYCNTKKLMNYCVGRQIEMTHLTFEKKKKLLRI